MGQKGPRCPRQEGPGGPRGRQAGCGAAALGAGTRDRPRAVRQVPSSCPIPSCGEGELAARPPGRSRPCAGRSRVVPVSLGCAGGVTPGTFPWQSCPHSALLPLGSGALRPRWLGGTRPCPLAQHSGPGVCPRPCPCPSCCWRCRCECWGAVSVRGAGGRCHPLPQPAGPSPGWVLPCGEPHFAQVW